MLGSSAGPLWVQTISNPDGKSLGEQVTYIPSTPTLCTSQLEHGFKGICWSEFTQAQSQKGQVSSAYQEKAEGNVLRFTFTKASLTSSACSMLRGVETVSPLVIMVRLVRQFITSWGSTWQRQHQTQLLYTRGSSNEGIFREKNQHFYTVF